MTRLVTIFAVLAAVVSGSTEARAHCDAADGPVAAAAVKALDTKNVNLVLPYAPPDAETELTAAFEQALVVRGKGAEARVLADRYFMETAVRLHRAGEHAPYTGLRPAGLDVGPVIPAAEEALASGELEPLLALMTKDLAQAIIGRFAQARASRATKEPPARTGVPAARDRVSAELGFIGYVEGIHAALRGGGHAE